MSAPGTAAATAATDAATRWIGVLFAIGSACFLVGPFPGFVELVGSEVDAAVFFAGSLFFTLQHCFRRCTAAAASTVGRVWCSSRGRSSST